MSALELFDFNGATVRTHLDGEAQPWFVANDVCKALGLSNVAQAVAGLDEDEKGLSSSDTPGGDQQVLMINEPGLYSLVIRSRKPEAKLFKRWITHEVLPALRRKGTYSIPTQRQSTEVDVASVDRKALALMVIAEAEAREAAEARAEVAEVRAIEATAKVAELTPLAVIAQGMINAGSDLSIADAAKALHRAGVTTGRNRLVKYLREIKWIDRRGHPYQAHVDAGRLAVKLGVYDHPTTGEATLSSTPRVTGKGLAELHYRLTGQMVLGA